MTSMLNLLVPPDKNRANCHNFGNIGWYLKHDKISDNNVVTKFRKTMNLQANLLANISEI